MIFHKVQWTITGNTGNLWNFLEVHEFPPNKKWKNREFPADFHALWLHPFDFIWQIFTNFQKCAKKLAEKWGKKWGDKVLMYKLSVSCSSTQKQRCDWSSLLYFQMDQHILKLVLMLLLICVQCTEGQIDGEILGKVLDSLARDPGGIQDIQVQYLACGLWKIFLWMCTTTNVQQYQLEAVLGASLLTYLWFGKTASLII